tara:strand:- start:4 stop:297 length:294 start_codon:yes stop_codon:yes gene_type:complete
MTRYHATKNGNVPFTEAEEKEWDEMEAAAEAAKPAIAWEIFRRERDAKLAQSDWMSFSDSPTMSDAWKTYRQELRDLPSKYDDTTVQGTITWPTEPS